MWSHPHRIDVTATQDTPTPKSWQSAMPGQDTVATLAVSDDTGPQMPGWCTTGGEVQGVETEAICGGINTKQPSHVGVWRQGNLLHFGFEPAPGKLNATGRKLLLNSIDYISRFVTDRPLARVRTFIDPDGAGPSTPWLTRLLGSDDVDPETLANMFAEPWKARIAKLDGNAARSFVAERQRALLVEGRKFAFSDLALELEIDLRTSDALTELTNKLETAHKERATALLHRLLPDGPETGTTANNWRSWLRARQRYLCRYPFQMVFRIDPVAQWRRVPTFGLQDGERADGQPERDTEAAALAAKIATFHGGARALDDLRSLSFVIGQEHYLWDRARGVLRIERHGEIPAGRRATPWKVIVFDTVADADLIVGGGPKPRPTISGRGMYRLLVERLFLPLMLLDPGTSLDLLGEDDDGNLRLGVKIAGRGLDPRRTHVVVAAPSGEVVAYDLGPSAASRTNVMKVTATTQVGPLTLPTAFSQAGRAVREYVYERATWNPAVPEGAAESKELLLGGN